MVDELTPEVRQRRKAGHEIAPLLFHDPNSPAAQMMTAIPTDFKALETMYVERVKRLFDGRQVN